MTAISLIDVSSTIVKTDVSEDTTTIMPIYLHTSPLNHSTLILQNKNVRVDKTLILILIYMLFD